MSFLTASAVGMEPPILSVGSGSTNHLTNRASPVGSLLHLAIVSRPDIVIAVGMVTRHIEKPGQRHWIAVKCILHYLKGTVTHGLVYRKSSNKIGIIMDVFCNADWVGDLEK